MKICFVSPYTAGVDKGLFRGGSLPEPMGVPAGGRKIKMILSLQRTRQQFGRLTGKTILALLGAGVLAGFAAASTVTISPGYTSIGVNQTVQYKAIILGPEDKTTIWKVGAAVGGNLTYGTIGPTGLYTAPAVIPTGGITITAVAVDGGSNTVYVNVAPPGPTITGVTPNPVSTGNYTITLTGSGFVKNAYVLEGGASAGTTFISPTTIKVSGWQGVAGDVPFQIMNPGTLWGPVFLVPFKAAGPPPPQSISPIVVSVNLGATAQFTSANAASWSTTAGTVSANGLYTAPVAMPATPTAKVTATGPGGSASATVTLLNPNAQTIAPLLVSLNLGAAQQFTSNGPATWSASAGSVDANGLYTAPAQLVTSTATVTASGVNGVASATVTFIPPAPSITSVNPSPLPLGIFTATVNGGSFLNTTTATLNGSPVTVQFVSASQVNISGSVIQSGQATLSLRNSSLTSAPFPVQVGIANPLVSSSAARRFLENAAFGPTPTEASNVQQLGPQGWLNEQYALPQISNFAALAGGSQGGLSAHFMTNAVMNQDQLRQRVGFALSQIFVTSINKLIWNSLMVPYQDTLLADAFTNYRQIMNDVTLSAAMGYYLDMGNNDKGNAAGTTLANENYAREILQLFTIGTAILNADGTPQVDAQGVPVPTYDQNTIQQFAKVFTGWTYAPNPNAYWNQYVNATGPMVAMQAHHDVSVKTLLNGQVLPAGQSAQKDLADALDNIFNHANMGPFVGKQMIQHLVKSKPSPAYVARVAAAFNDNGQGVRGDMRAILNAVLLDPEARQNDAGGADQPTDGHLQEPALYLPGVIRAFGGQVTDQNYFAYELTLLGQDLFNPPSVFNYYSPGNEMQIYTPWTAIYRSNLVYGLFHAYNNPVQTYGPGTTINLTPYVALAGTPAALVDALDLALTHGDMPAAMKTMLVSAVTAEAGGAVARVEVAVYLIIASGYYNVWH